MMTERNNVTCCCVQFDLTQYKADTINIHVTFKMGNVQPPLPLPPPPADEDDTESDSDIDLLDVDSSESSLCRTGSSVKSDEISDPHKDPMEARTSRTSHDSSCVDYNFSKLKDEKKPVSLPQSPALSSSSSTQPQTLELSDSCHTFSKLGAPSSFHPRHLSVMPDMHMQHVFSFIPGLNSEENRGLHSQSVLLPPFGYQLPPEVLEYQVCFRKPTIYQCPF